MKVSLQGALLDVDLWQARPLATTRKQEMLTALDVAPPQTERYRPRNVLYGAGSRTLSKAPASARDFRIASKSKLPPSIGPKPAEEVQALLVRGNRRSAEQFKKYKGQEPPHCLRGKGTMIGNEEKSLAVIFHSFKE